MKKVDYDFLKIMVKRKKFVGIIKYFITINKKYSWSGWEF